MSLKAQIWLIKECLGEYYNVDIAQLIVDSKNFYDILCFYNKNTYFGYYNIEFHRLIGEASLEQLEELFEVIHEYKTHPYLEEVRENQKLEYNFALENYLFGKKIEVNNYKTQILVDETKIDIIDGIRDGKIKTHKREKEIIEYFNS